jgi:hypothetical protein
MKSKQIKKTCRPFLIVIPIYDGVDLMDIASPREIFGWLSLEKSFQRKIIKYVGKKEGTFTTNNGVTIGVESAFRDAYPRNS